MKNFIPPKNIIGTIKVSADEYYIGDANLAIEKIGEHEILNLWGSSFHYEIHNNEKILISDASFEIMQPLTQEVSNHYLTKIEFPDAIERMENEWEILYYSHFYQFEHLKISNWEITLIPNNDIYHIKVKGSITDDISKQFENHFFEGSLQIEKSEKINSKFNWHYSSKNPKAKNLT